MSTDNLDELIDEYCETYWQATQALPKWSSDLRPPQPKSTNDRANDNMQRMLMRETARGKISQHFSASAFQRIAGPLSTLAKRYVAHRSGFPQQRELDDARALVVTTIAEELANRRSK